MVRSLYASPAYQSNTAGIKASATLGKIGRSRSDYELGVVAKARVSKVFCSSSWALEEPVAGLALAERFTERTRMFLSLAMRSRRGST